MENVEVGFGRLISKKNEEFFNFIRPIVQLPVNTFFNTGQGKYFFFLG